jgi:peptide/nickel transport system permease protein
MISRIRPKRLAWRLSQQLLAVLATVLLGTFIAAILVRVAPGFDVDDQQLDSRLTHESRDLLRSRRAENTNILVFYTSYLRRSLHGDLGYSQTFSRPIRELLAERLPVTARLITLGLLWGWIVAMVMAVGSALARVNSVGVLVRAAAGIPLCVPSAVLAMIFVFARAPAYLAISLVVLPKVFGITRNLLMRGYAMPHVVTARAKGIGEARVLLWHVLPVTGGQIVALAGVSVTLALGAAVPVEALCGLPGVGQLAWQAALGRDLPVLVAMTMIVALVTITSNTMANAINDGFGSV